jgi:NAD(P)H-nitrite reductase large subunit
MQTSAPDVFAAGDVAQGVNQSSGERQVVATWVNACVQGRTAGTNMSGGHASCTGLSGNVCSILGNSVASVGVTRPDPDRHHWQSYTAPDGAYYRNVIFGQNDEVVGAVMMGTVSDIGLIRNMIQNRVRVSGRLKEKIIHGPISYGDLYGCCLKKV